MLRRVDLPQPDGPMMQRNSFDARTKLMPLRASTRSFPRPSHTFPMFSTETVAKSAVAFALFRKKAIIYYLSDAGDFPSQDSLIMKVIELFKRRFFIEFSL